VFVYTSGWCLACLAALGEPRLAGLIYVGPGLGIAASGLAATAMVAGRHERGSRLVDVRRAGNSFLTATGVAPACEAAVAVRGPGRRAPAQCCWPRRHGGPGDGVRPGRVRLHHHGDLSPRDRAAGAAGLDLARPVLAPVRPGRGGRRLAHDPLSGALGSAPSSDGLLRHAGQQGSCSGVWWPSLAGFALGSLLIGLPFTAITLFAMQEARRVRPEGASGFIGLLTAFYGLGQIAGPPWVALMLQRSANSGPGLCALVADGGWPAWWWGSDCSAGWPGGIR
jgi:hypothetical protein